MNLSKPSIYDQFRAKCVQIIDQPQFANWKSDAIITDMLEHEYVQVAETFLDTLTKRFSRDQIQNIVEINDSVGGTKLHLFEKYNIIASPSSIRYMLHAFEIFELIKSKKATRTTIVEVGGGYGGLALTMHLMSQYFDIEIEKYIIYDLEEVQKLQEFYLSCFPQIKRNVIWGNAETFGSNLLELNQNRGSHLLWVSNYCLSELEQTYRTRYIENILPHCNSLFMRYNKQSPFNDLPFTCNVVEETANTYHQNWIVRF